MIKDILTVALLISGFIFMEISVLGIFKYKDFFCRLQLMAVGQALGIVLCCLGLFVYEGLTGTGIKILVVMLFTLVGGPIGTHIIDKVAYKEAVRNRESARNPMLGEEKKSCL